jgi:hypothetical protein
LVVGPHGPDRCGEVEMCGMAMNVRKLRDKWDKRRLK